MLMCVKKFSSATRHVCISFNFLHLNQILTRITMTTNDQYCRIEVRDDMHITWHQPITMDDGLVLRADI